MMKAFFSVTIIVGATDESGALMQTVETVMRTCRPDDIREILIVRSADASVGCLSAIDALEKEYPGKVRGMQQIRPHIGGAIRDGFDTAESSHILLLPGDLAIDVNTVPELIGMEKQYPHDIVKTSRWLRKNSFHGYDGLRKLFNAVSQIFLRFLFQTRLTDLTNPVQIMPTELYASIDWKELNFPFLVELILAPLRLGTRIHEIPASCYGRKEGISKNTVTQTVLYLKTALRIRFTSPGKLKKND